MKVDSPELAERASYLAEMAKKQGFNSIMDELKTLPSGDQVARIGYLANVLGLDTAVAFDLSETPEGEEA